MKKIINNAILICLICLISVFALMVYTLPKQSIIVQTPDEKIIYLQQECTSKKCEQDNFQVIETPSNQLLNAKVFGTIYEDRDNATIWGTCSNNENKPLESNATINLFYPNSTLLLNKSNMSRVSTGIFNLTVALDSTRGNYLIMLNCSEGANSAVAYAEFQNPNWANKIQDIVTDVRDVMSKKDFRIDKLTAVSPIYPNETVVVEATFSDGNGSLVTPDEMNLTIFYPNRSQFIYKSKSDFATINNVWNYSEKLTSNPKTGTYFVHLQANDSINRKSVKTIQFRIATGGPYRLSVDCTAVIESGSALTCVVDITDEGEIATESTTTVWIDTDNDNNLNDLEPQTSFSKRTVPQQFVSESATINVPISHPAGTFIVRVKTSYLGSTQPDSTASDTISIITSSGIVGATGDGTFGTSTNCNKYIIAYNSCYYSDGVSCKKGCPTGQGCVQYQCIQSNQTASLPILSQKPLPFWTRFFDWIRSLLGLSADDPNLPQNTLSILENKPIVEGEATTEQVKKIFQENKWLPYVIIALVIAVFGIYAFGLWQAPLALLMGLGIWSYIIIALIGIIAYLFFRWF